MAELDKYMMLSARTYTCKTIGKDKAGKNILESRETYKTPIGEIEIGKWAKRVEEAAKADGKAELLERIKERASKLAWMQRADELEIKIYACECLLDKAYEHWEDFEVDGENKNEY